MQLGADTPMLALVENARRKQLGWINAILNHTMWSPHRLAKEARVDPSTLSKFLNDPSNTAQLATPSVEKIAGVAPFPPYETKRPDQVRGIAEGEAGHYDPREVDSYIDAAVLAIFNGRNGLEPWTLQSRALETAGYLPGDVVVADLNATPHDGDAVCAQILDRSGNTETIFRIYERPYLMAATYSRGLFKPLLIDNDRVVVRGVVVASIRPRLSLLAAS